MRMRKLLVLFIACISVALTGLNAQQGGDAPAPAQSGAAGADRSSPRTQGDGASGVSYVGSNYVLRASDIVEVSVFNEHDLRKAVRVESDNTVSLPLIGRVRIGEMTVAEAQELITQLYDRDFIVNPQVSLLVLEFSMETVRILGAVNSPGVVSIPPDRGLTLTDAIAGSNGISRLGNSRSVQIRRVNEDGSTRVLDVNFDQILSDPNARDIPLRDGDTIFVRERIF
jgi:polysaccharide export outer membrane protein